MSPATLSPPPVVAAPPIRVQTAPAPRLPIRAPLRRERSREGGLRVTRAGVLASLGIHAILAVLLVVGIDQALRRGHARGTAEPRETVSYLDVSQWPTGAPSAGVTAPAGTAAAAAQAVTAAAIDSALARIPDLRHFPDRAPDRLPPAPAAGNGAPSPAPAPQPGAGTSTAGANGEAIGGDAAGGRLGAGYGDRRLIVTPQAVPERQKTEHEQYMEHLGAVIGAYNDSLASEAAREHRLHNWTWRDKNGREWGIGEKGPIVAGHQIPVPIAPPILMGRDRENAQRTETRERAEIDRQADAGDRERNFRERVKAMRRHHDEERRKQHEQSSSGSSGSSSTPPPSGGTP